MERSEAVLIIRSLAESLRSQPGQFQFDVSVTSIGQRIVSNGGIGMVVTANGGGPGSSVIGNQVTMGNAEVDISLKAAKAGISQQMQSLIDSLNEIAGQLESEKPDRGYLSKIIGSFKDTWVPPLVTTVVTTVLGLFLA